MSVKFLSWSLAFKSLFSSEPNASMRSMSSKKSSHGAICRAPRVRCDGGGDGGGLGLCFLGGILTMSTCGVLMGEGIQTDMRVRARRLRQPPAAPQVPHVPMTECVVELSASRHPKTQASVATWHTAPRRRSHRRTHGHSPKKRQLLHSF